MDRRPKNLLLTGPPGCGKTTVIRRALEQLGGQRLAGFYTREIRQGGQRVGFEILGLSGGKGVLAHVDSPGRPRVGRYGVNLTEFEDVVRLELQKPCGEVDLFVIDEIGKMECFSGLFMDATERVLDGPSPVLATVAAKGSGFIGDVKNRPDVEILLVSAANRDGLPDIIVRRLSTG
jgi:nucleoside-triphosphatase